MRTRWILLVFLFFSLAIQADAQTQQDQERIPILPTMGASESSLFQTESASSPESQPAGGRFGIHHLWGDIDKDGLKDLFVLSSEGNKLFRNRGTGDFDDATSLWFTDAAGEGMAGVFGDCDRDGWPDIYLFHAAGFSLFRNEGGLRFVDVTRDSGLDPALRGTAIRLDDFDRDGFEDLLVRTPGGDRIYHNRAGLGFEKVCLPGVVDDPGMQAGTRLPRLGHVGAPEEGDRTLESADSDSESSGSAPLGSNDSSQPHQQGLAKKNMSAKNSFGSRSAPFLPPVLVGTSENSGRGVRPDEDWNYWDSYPDMFTIPSGNVGIGTSSPNAKLEVRIGESVGGGIVISDPDSTIAVLADGGSADDSGILKLFNGTETEERIRLFAYPTGDSWFNSRNVGIGTTDPVQKLDVRGDTCLMGDVGIGTANPDYPLHIHDSTGNNLALTTGGSAYASLKLASTYTNEWFTVGGNWGGMVLSSPRDIFVIPSAAYDFKVRNSDLIVEDGNIGVGTLTPNAGVDVDVSTQYAGEFRTGYSGSSPHVVHAQYAGTGDGTAVYGLSTPSDEHGIGGYFKGGRNGVEGWVSAAGNGSYKGVYGNVTGGSGTKYGVYGFASGTGTCYGVYGETSGTGNNYAGYFWGDVHVNGALSKSSGSFKIDHPLDPANKYLYHSFVESPDMMNIYNGNALLDESGDAWVEMPAWFEALNQEFRYQLTCVGGFSPVYVDEEIVENRFKIAGGRPGQKVSWQVTGIRHDPYAEKNRIPVEVDKQGAERGRYLNPAAYDMPETAAVAHR